MKRALALIAIFGILASPIAVRTQQPQSAPQVSGPVYPQQLSVDSQGVKNYLLGPGDVLDVRVLFQPDLNAMPEVDDQGNISSLPFLESPIPAKCRNEKEVQTDIAKAYAKYLKNPQISVKIAEKKSRPPATVTGAVSQPTRVIMLRKVRLNELIAAAEGLTERASGTIEIVHSEPVMCPQPGEEALAKPFEEGEAPRELIKIADLRAGKALANPVIRPGDFVTVFEAEPVYVTGSVLQPQAIYLTDNLMLTRALAMVGGTTKEAKTSDVQIYRQKPGDQAPEVIRVDYAAIRKLQKPDVRLEAFDQVDVPQAGMFSPARIGQTLMGVLTGSAPGMITNGFSRPSTTRTTIIR